MTPYRISPAAAMPTSTPRPLISPARRAWTPPCASYDAAASTFGAIARMPGIGELRASLNPRLEGLRVRRIDGFESLLVFYRPSDDGIEIVRVLHGARDIPKIIDSDDDDRPSP
jgi:plasmid stabilization system protein ParE